MYWGENYQGDKVYKSKHYLLWTCKDTVELLNLEKPLRKISYYMVQKQLRTKNTCLKLGKVKMTTVDAKNAKTLSCYS